MRLLVTCVLLALLQLHCVDESFPEGLFCSPDGRGLCPPGQACVQENDGRFFCHLANPGDPDGAVSGSVDADLCPPGTSCEGACPELGALCAGSGSACYWVEPEGAFCLGSGGGEQGQSCDMHEMCAPGLGCHETQDGSSSECLRYTNMDDTACAVFQQLLGNDGYCMIETL